MPAEWNRGYSGGGRYGDFEQGYPGGSNGSDGDGDDGGLGSGFDLSTIILRHYILSPGSGGEGSLPSSHCTEYDDFGAGGGGGGVLVNGEGPNCCETHGQGYGGGSGCSRSGCNTGLQGMVLIEVQPIF